jgi:hypothetical protein
VSELDRALERFQRTAPEFGPGLANHGPMVCEAQAELGHEALIPAYVERYAPRLPPFVPGRPIPAEERAAALGRPERTADWIASYDEVLRERPWREVLAEAAAGLAPGLFASAAHGWLRSAQAARSLAAEDSPLRRRELAHGLGLWAARYQELPGRPGGHPGKRVPRLADLAALPAAARRPGLFSDAVKALAGHRAFASWVEGLELAGADPLALAAAACREAARLYLQHPGQRVAYAHTITAASALRLVAPHLPGPLLHALLGHALQAAGALHAVSFGPGPVVPAERAAAERLAGDAAEIGYRAACSLDDHAVKLAEACLREDAAAPDPGLRLAAADAALHLGGPQRSC